MAVSETDRELKGGPPLDELAALTWWTGNDHDIAAVQLAGPEQGNSLLNHLVSLPRLSSSPPREAIFIIRDALN